MIIRLVRLPTLLGIVGVVGMLGSGCVQTAMLPAQQLEGGTTAVSVSVDEPGVLYIPRLNAQVARGFGKVDLAVNLSAVPIKAGAFSGGGGLTGRYYLTPRANAEVQVQSVSLADPDGSTLALLGVQEVPTGSDSWYLGGQVGAIRKGGIASSGLERSAPGPERAGKLFPVVGASLGYGPIEIGDSWQMQIELESNVPLRLGRETAPPNPPTRLSIGVFGVFQ